MNNKHIKICIIVSKAPYGYQAASSAYNFAQAALNAGHKIVGVFFYQDGVLNASNLVTPATDEMNLPDLWSELSNKYKIPLEVCISAALRRGMIDEKEAKNLSISQYNIHPDFTLSGLGQLAELSALADRVVQF